MMAWLGLFTDEHKEHLEITEDDNEMLWETVEYEGNVQCVRDVFRVSKEYANCSHKCRNSVVYADLLGRHQMNPKPRCVPDILRVTKEFLEFIHYQERHEYGRYSTDISVSYSWELIITIWMWWISRSSEWKEMKVNFFKHQKLISHKTCESGRIST